MRVRRLRLLPSSHTMEVWSSESEMDGYSSSLLQLPTDFECISGNTPF